MCAMVYKEHRPKNILNPTYPELDGFPEGSNFSLENGGIPGGFCNLDTFLLDPGMLNFIKKLSHMAENCVNIRDYHKLMCAYVRT